MVSPSPITISSTEIKGCPPILLSLAVITTWDWGWAIVALTALLIIKLKLSAFSASWSSIILKGIVLTVSPGKNTTWPLTAS